MRLERLLKFSQSDLNKHGHKIAMEHKKDILAGIDAEGEKFKGYTPQYKQRKAAGTAAKGRQKSMRTNPPNLMLTGAMLSKFKFLNATGDTGSVGGKEMSIEYGIKDQKEATKLWSHSKGRFGKTRKTRRVVRREDKIREVAKTNAIGISAPVAVVNMFASVINKNLSDLSQQHSVTVYRM